MKKKKPIISGDSEQKANKMIKLVKQANGLIEARYNFSIWEMRLFKTMISLIKPEDQEFKKTIVPIKEVLEEYEIGTSGFAYGLVKEAYKNLKKRFVYVPYVNDEGQKRLQIMPLFTLIDIPLEIRDSKDSYLILKFNDELKPFLLQVQNRYTLYDPIILKNIDSSYTVRIYELLKEYEFRGEAKIDLEEFREMIGAKEYDEDFNVIKDTFKVWQDLKRYVIMPAHSEINQKTDICFEFEPLYENKVGKGRKPVNGIHLKEIRQNPNRKSSTPKRANKKSNNTIIEIESIEEVDTDFQEVFSLVKEYVSEANVKKWLKELPKEQVIKGIQYTINYIQAGNKVKNIGGMLNTMVQTPNLFDKYEDKKTKVKKEAKKQEDKVEKVAEKKQELQKVWTEFKTKEHELEQRLFEQDPSLKQKLLDKIQANSFYDHKKSLEENLKRESIQGLWVGNLMIMFQEYSDLTKYYDARIKMIRDELVVLGHRE